MNYRVDKNKVNIDVWLGLMIDFISFVFTDKIRDFLLTVNQSHVVDYFKELFALEIGWVDFLHLQ